MRHMADWWDYIKGLFTRAEESSPSRPVIHELIQRSEKEKEDYADWKKTLVRRRLQDWLLDQYAVYRVSPADIDESLDFLDTPSSKGFVIHFHKTRYSPRDVRHFFDFLKEQVLRLDYRAQLSDVRTFNRPAWVATVERHYLKPGSPFRRQTPPGTTSLDTASGSSPLFNQRFGNITVELVLRDERPHYLKFQATAYQDRLFTEAEDFRNLMQFLSEG